MCLTSWPVVACGHFTNGNMSAGTLVVGQGRADSEQTATSLACLKVAVEVLMSFSKVTGLQLRSLKVTFSKCRMLQCLLQNWPFPDVGHRHTDVNLPAEFLRPGCFWPKLRAPSPVLLQTKH